MKRNGFSFSLKPYTFLKVEKNGILMLSDEEDDHQDKEFKLETMELKCRTIMFYWR